MDVQPLMFTGRPEVLFEDLAILCAGLFAGAALYITFVEHPARRECGAELAATEFGPSYRRATLMQASLAAIGLLMALTLIAILPTNKRLLDPGLDRNSTEAAVRGPPAHSTGALESSS
jgi:hypothetical protein